MCKNCNHPTPQPDQEALQFLIDDAVEQISHIRSRLYPLLHFVISQVEVEESRVAHDSSRLFAETMLVTIRDLRNQICDVQEMLRKKQ